MPEALDSANNFLYILPKVLSMAQVGENALPADVGGPDGNPDEFIDPLQIGNTLGALERLHEENTLILDNALNHLQSADEALKKSVVDSMIPKVDPNPVLNQALQEAKNKGTQQYTGAIGPQTAQQLGPLEIVNQYRQNIADVQQGVIKAQDPRGLEQLYTERVGQTVAPTSHADTLVDTLIKSASSFIPIVGDLVQQAYGPNARTIGREFLAGRTQAESTAQAGAGFRQPNAAQYQNQVSQERFRLGLMEEAMKQGLSAAQVQGMDMDQLTQHLGVPTTRRVFEQSYSGLAAQPPAGSPAEKKIQAETTKTSVETRTNLAKTVQDIEKGKIDQKKATMELEALPAKIQAQAEELQQKIAESKSLVESRKTGEAALQQRLGLEEQRVKLAEQRAELAKTTQGAFGLLGTMIEKGWLDEPAQARILTQLFNTIMPAFEAVSKPGEGIKSYIPFMDPGADVTITPKTQPDKNAPVTEEQINDMIKNRQ